MSARAEGAARPPAELIDIPTAEVVDYGTFWLNFRLHDNGGVASRGVFGVVRRLNFGGSWDIDELIGLGTIKIRAPQFYLKVRAFDGNRYFPALALGYDGQGYGTFLDSAAATAQGTYEGYRHKDRGLYFVLSRELFAPDLEFHLGPNIPRLGKETIATSDLRLFFGTSYLYGKTLHIMTELDNIGGGADIRWNAGLRYHLTPSFALEFAIRNLVGRGDVRERVIRIDYLGTF